jgi:hypothetical protein
MLSRESYGCYIHSTLKGTIQRTQAIKRSPSWRGIPQSSIEISIADSKEVVDEAIGCGALQASFRQKLACKRACNRVVLLF